MPPQAPLIPENKLQLPQPLRTNTHNVLRDTV